MPTRQARLKRIEHEMLTLFNRRKRGNRRDDLNMCILVEQSRRVSRRKQAPRRRRKT
jgi:hypothetical protein